MGTFDRKDDAHFIRWAAEVKRLAHYTCDVCGRRGVYLNSHHKNGWNKFRDERYDISNGVCLCNECHDRFHRMYGFGNNTEEQFDEFYELSEALIRAVNANICVEQSVKDAIRYLDGYDVAIQILKDLDGYE